MKRTTLRCAVACTGVAVLVATSACSSGRVADANAPRAIVVPSPKPTSGAATLVPIPDQTKDPRDANPANGSRPTATPNSQSLLVAKMLRRVERARGHKAKSNVPGVVLSRKELLGRIRAHVATEVPPEAIVNEGNVLKLFGFVPTSYDYLAGTFALLEAQLAGYYEPADGTMYLAGDLNEENATATLAHELVHALQDQYWDLKAQSHYRPGESDLSSARSALAEGDATSAMTDVMIDLAGRKGGSLDVPDEQIAALMMAGVMAESGNTPDVMKRSLVAPYVDGLLFVNQLRRHGGWDAVDEAWKTKPTTTEQILHVDKWLAHEPAEPVKAPAASVLGPAFATRDTDSLGELGVRLMLEQWIDVPSAKLHAAHWGGDVSQLVADGAKQAIVVRLRYDADAKEPAFHAKATWASLELKMPRKLGAPQVRDTSNLMCFQRAELGPLIVARRDRDLVVVAGPSNVATNGRWSSAGRCADARRIVDAIVAPAAK